MSLNEEFLASVAAVLSDTATKVSQAPVSTPVAPSPVAAAASAPGAFFTGIYIPVPIAGATTLPLGNGANAPTSGAAAGVTDADPTLDWDSVFDATDSTNAKFPCAYATYRGEFGGSSGVADGDARYKLVFKCGAPSSVKAAITLYTPGSTIGSLQIKLNGKIYSYTSQAMGANVLHTTLTLSLVAGQNVLSVARAFGTSFVRFDTSILGSSATWTG